MPSQAAGLDHFLVKGDKENNEAVGTLVGGNESYIYGITGGNVYLDSGTNEKIDTLTGLSALLPDSIKEVIGTVNSFVDEKTTSLEGTTANDTASGLYLTNHGKADNVVRYYGAHGGDLVINANLHSGAQGENTSVSATTGSRTNELLGGSVIGGVGGSIALGVGNVEASASVSFLSLTYRTGGDAHATIAGDVKTEQGAEANVIGFMNGGLAAGVGSTATSTVTGSTEYTINGDGRSDHEGGYQNPEEDAIPQLTTALNVMEGSKVNAIGVMGGGTAVSTLGGTAEAAVNGTSTIRPSMRRMWAMCWRIK